MTKSVGVVGTGMLGLAVALRLATCGLKVAAYNRTSAKAAAVEAAGGSVVDTPASVAACSDVVISVVRDAAAVRSVSFGQDGILDGCDKQTVVADMSTIAPADSMSIHKRFAEGGVRWLDAPVMGGPDAVAEGRLVVMASGDELAYRGIRDVFAALSDKQYYLGTAGTAHSIKLCMNLQIAMLSVAISEGVCLARGLGVEPESFLDVLNSTYFGTGMSRRKAYKMIQGKYPATFTLDNLTKDLRTINVAARHSGVDLEATSAVLNMYERACDVGLGGLDYTGILEYIQRQAARMRSGPQ